MTARRAALGLLLLLAACGRKPAAPALVLDRPSGKPATLEAVGLDSAALKTLRALPGNPDAWTPVLSLSVGPGLPPVMGRYAVTGGAVRFTPAFPLEPGRTYIARLDLGDGKPLTTQVTAAGAPAEAQTALTAVYPSGPVVPQNLLRLYLQFSAPMAQGRPGSLGLLDEAGKPVDTPFLPLGIEFWSPDHTRLTVLIDPGRVKRGILPGSVLMANGRYTLTAGSDWRDARGAPVRMDLHYGFSVGPAQRTALDLKAWRIAAPPKGSRTPLRVQFDRPLDHGLLLSGLGVADADGERLAGKADAEPGETAWSFTPDKPWRAGGYRLLVQPWIEDPAGNRPGVAFERTAGAPAAATKLIEMPFRPTGN